MFRITVAYRVVVGNTSLRHIATIIEHEDTSHINTIMREGDERVFIVSLFYLRLTDTHNKQFSSGNLL